MLVNFCACALQMSNKGGCMLTTVKIYTINIKTNTMLVPMHWQTAK